MKGRFTAVFLFFILLAGAVVSRAVAIQLVRDSRLDNLARRQFQSRLLIRPSRGLIVDRNGEALAVNVEGRSLAVNPSKVENRRTLTRLLARALDLSWDRVNDRLSKKGEFAWLKRQLTEGDLHQLRRARLMDADGELHPGLLMVKESRRVYPHRELSGQILGSVNLDGEGLEGVELWGDDHLRGKVVSVSAVRDALGRPTFLDAVAAKDVQDGESIELSLDASLQFSVERELRSSVLKSGARGGTVIVMDSVTGEILALANEPSFNPGDSGVPAAKRRNRAVTDGYEPGSTLKPVLLAGALASGMRLTDTVHGENGSMVIQGHRISEAEAHERFTTLSLKKMIQVSSNVGAAKLALRYGADAYSQWLKTLGFGQKTGLGFPGEISGKVPARKLWQPLTTANIGFGQGILVTPIQMLRAYAAFANGGFLVQPSLLRNPQKLKGFEPVAPKRILSPAVSQQVTEALLAVTDEGGTGGKARVDGYRIAGKTGTAQAVDPRTGRYSRSHYIASFIGYPVGVEPKLVVLTLIDEPRGVYYASETAAPLFRAVLQSAANRFSLPTLAQAGPIQEQVTVTRAAPARGAERGPSPPTAPRGISQETPLEAAPLSEAEPLAGNDSAWRMPDLKGQTIREVLAALKASGAEVEVQGQGVVVSQHPVPGQPFTRKTSIRLRLGDP